MRFSLQCNISSPVSISTLAMLEVQPSSFACRMVEEYPQRPSIVPRLLHLVSFCEEPFPEQFYRRSSTERGNEMGPDSRVSLHDSESKGGGKRYASRVVTTTLTEIGVELEFIAKEFSRNVEIFATDYDDVLTIEELLGDGGGKTTCTADD